MAVNLEQFHQVFFEESFEGLDVMETSLMELDPDKIDDETINAIFRSAHSIKGGSATFGFSAIAEFTHVLETLLDQVRSGKRNLPGSDIDLLLRSVDCMREMLSLLQAGNDGWTDAAKELKSSFEKLLDEKVTTKKKSPSSKKKRAVKAEAERWCIRFSPHVGMLASGNDAQRILQELSKLGELELSCDTTRLPGLSVLNPHECFLAWTVYLDGKIDKKLIEAVFDWVVDDCDLSIEPVSSRAGFWQISFLPHVDILRSGNEPQRLLRALGELGNLEVKVDFSKLPSMDAMDPESCYLNWTLALRAEVKEEQIREIFEWVADDSRVDIVFDNGAIDEQSVEPASPLGQADAQQESTQEVLTKGEGAKSASAKKSTSVEPSSIRVAIDKVDTLINMVGELVITQSMLGQLSSEYELDRIPKMMEGLSQLEQNTRELQESVMKIRMMPISFAFSRFPRMVRDLGQRLGKQITVEMQGEQTELDKTVMEKIGDPLVHLVRNSVDHGIETPAERKAKGKNPTGKVLLNAFHQSGNVVIEIIDDGKGLDSEKILAKAVEKGLVAEKDMQYYNEHQIFDLIFQPGFSTAQAVSDVSGRGVGMDVVKRNIQALNGVVEIQSQKDKGSKITIKLPLTLAILDGQLVRVGNQTFVISLVSIIESLQCREDFVNRVANGCKVFKLREDYVPIVELYKVFNVEPDSTALDDSLLVVVETEGEKVGIVVDELLAQQQVVIKSLEQNYQRVEGVSGATILGDGTVALILDVPGIVKLSAVKLGLHQASAHQIGMKPQQIMQAERSQSRLSAG